MTDEARSLSGCASIHAGVAAKFIACNAGYDVKMATAWIQWDLEHDLADPLAIRS